MVVLNLNPVVHSERVEMTSTKDGLKSRTFPHGPGEMDMLIGFFVMNGACIAFFLLFGSCVICSCLRGMNSSGNSLLKSANGKNTPSNSSRSSFQRLIPSTVPKTTFKSIVARAIDKERYKSNRLLNDCSTHTSEMANLQREHSVVDLDGTNTYTTPIKIQIDSQMDCDNDEKQALEQGDNDTNEMPSLIRHNLLGPLSFDDLYYTQATL